MSFVGSSAEKATDGSTIKVHGSTLLGSVSRTYGEKGNNRFCPPMSSRSDFVITRKKLIHNSIDESKKPSLKPSPKSVSWLPNVANVLTHIDNAAKDEDPKYWPVCYRIIRMGNECTGGRGGMGRRPREGNDECVDDLNGQGNDQGLRANRGVERVNGNVEGANKGAPDFSTIIA
ncbi:hypothetical protein Tco_0798383 [Tanacetum coccineum]